MIINRQHKSSAFTTLFGEPDVFIELYNALTGSTYPLGTVMQPVTLTDVLFMDRQNDVAFVIGESIVVLVEHQATICNNLPLRLLQYIARVYELIVDNKEMYKEALIKIPKPEFIVLYNGTKSFPDEQTLKLSDAFKQPPYPGLGGALDLSVRVVNINKGYNQVTINNSNHLKGYVEFIAMIRNNQKTGLSLGDAIKKAVSDCIAQGILVDFLKRHGSEVINMLIQEFNLETAKEVWQEEAREEGRIEAREETLILATVNVIKGLSLSVTDAMALMNLDAKHRNRLIEELKRQGVEYTE